MRTLAILLLLLTGSVSAAEPGVKLRDGTFLPGRVLFAGEDHIRLRTANEEYRISRRMVADWSTPRPLEVPRDAATSRLLLRDGGFIVGTILGDGEDSLEVRVEESVFRVPRGRVLSVERMASVAPAEPAAPAPPLAAIPILRDPARSETLLVERLELTEEQRVRAKKILEETARDLASAVEAFSAGSRQEAVAGIRAQVDAFKEKMRAILTGPQYRRLERLLDTRR